MNDYLVLELAVYFTVFLQMIGLIFAVFIDPYIGKKHGIVILINALFTTLLVLQNYWDTVFANDLELLDIV